MARTRRPHQLFSAHVHYIAPFVDSVNQHRICATTNAQQRPQSVRTSVTAYSKLAHDFVNHNSVALSATPLSVGSAAAHALPYAPKSRNGAIASLMSEAPESPTALTERSPHCALDDFHPFFDRVDQVAIPPLREACMR